MNTELDAVRGEIEEKFEQKRDNKVKKHQTNDLLLKTIIKESHDLNLEAAKFRRDRTASKNTFTCRKET